MENLSLPLGDLGDSMAMKTPGFLPSRHRYMEAILGRVQEKELGSDSYAEEPSGSSRCFELDQSTNTGQVEQDT